jgi:hypothetical protein
VPVDEDEEFDETSASPATPDQEDLAMAGQIDIHESYFTVAEVAKRLKVNEETVRRLFLHEPGVIVICFPRKGRRVYRTLRIPERVYQRVLTRFTTVANA